MANGKYVVKKIVIDDIEHCMWPPCTHYDEDTQTFYFYDDDYLYDEDCGEEGMYSESAHECHDWDTIEDAVTAWIRESLIGFELDPDYEVEDLKFDGLITHI